MYNLSKLSQSSQLFLKTVTGNGTTDIAVGKAVAAKMPLPSFEVASYQQHYMAVVEAQARESISQINEIVIIDAKAVLCYVEMFWKVRYLTLFPQTNAVLGAGNAIGTFMGYGNVIPMKTYDDIAANLARLMRDVHGFNQIVEELSTKEVTSEEEPAGDTISAANVVSAETYTGARRRPILAGA